MPVHVRTKSTVLVVDDDRSIRLMLTSALTLYGYDVVSAERVDEAIAVLEKKPVDAIVLDVRMPGRCGLELLDHIRRHRRLRRLPVMVLTGEHLTDDEHAAVKRHGAELFYKPESHFPLVAHLDQATGRLGVALSEPSRRPRPVRSRRH